MELKDRIHRWLAYEPPGYASRREFNLLWVWFGISVLYSFQFFLRLLSEYNGLFVYVNQMGYTKLVMREDAVMPPFGEVLGSGASGFAIGMWITVCFIGYRYLYHFRGSKSIYLMRRMKKRSLLWKNCLLVPLGEAAGFAVAGILLRLLYTGIYLLVTPGKCLTSVWWR